MDSIAQRAKSLEKELIETRRFFHQHPETGWFTFFTTAKIIEKLKTYGYTLKMGREIMVPEARQGVGSKEALEEALLRAKKLLSPEEYTLLDVMEDGLTGVIAELDTGREGPCIAFRFDIDAVDVTESKDLAHRPFKEGFRADIDGIAHTCGHDGHITIGLGLAKLISEHKEDFKGTFRFIFQTAEEGTRGAVAMEKAGILKGVDYLLGAHIGFQSKKSGGLICGVNNFLATSKFDVTFHGTSAHAAGAPEEGANALLAAAEAALLMHGITRHSQGITRINVGVLKAGEGRNVIAPNAFMACETRGVTTELNDFMKAKCMNILEGVSKIHSVGYSVKDVGGTSGGDSSPFITDVYEKAALASPFIDKDSIVKTCDFGACEDFAHFMQAVQNQGGQSGYMMIGAKLEAGHHNQSFDFDESCLVTGVDLFLRAAYMLGAQ
ncbi:amidohydrolase [Sulfurospirillum deleyianum]|uniref:Amidohydrolase n=1 Tax=Sulfurospirillum deleyianum (strain ATCC 51133 / DSM 6946 / 5175) TaxID=525898 RepID=D1B108_SULD5|nr:amidohydrolase [Sulfurospirillum deleyianum]ACZ11778.1 amidohydrolase [Sulfurospirillum deleyianum DSM 6946]